MDFSIPASPKGIKSSNMINICRNLLIDNRTMGLIIFTVDGDILADEMYSGDINETENILLFNENNELIYASSLDVFEKLNIDANKILEETTYKRETEFSSGEYLYNAIASENHDFKIVSALSMQAYNKDYRHIISIALLYFLITFVLAVIFSLIIAFRFYRSIVDVVIKTASTEETPENVTANENNELVYLSDTLFNTVKNHQKIESELVDTVEEKSDCERKRELLEKTKIVRQTWSILEIYQKIREKNLVLTPDYQRSVVWKNDKKTAFIESLYMEIMIPPIYVVEMPGEDLLSANKYEVVDGKQRLTAIMEFVSGKLELAKKSLEYYGDIFGGKNFNDIKETYTEKTTQMLSSILDIYVITSNSPEFTKYDIFAR